MPSVKSETFQGLRMSLLVASITVSTNFVRVIKSEKMTVTENTERVAG